MSDRSQQIAAEIARKILLSIPEFLGMTPDPWPFDEERGWWDDQAAKDVEDIIAAALRRQSAEAAPRCTCDSG